MRLYEAIKAADLDLVSQLVSNDTSTLSERNELGWTPLHVISAQGEDTVKTHSEIALLLISNGADVNAQDNIGFTPLHYIAVNGSRESLCVAKVLLENGANPNVVSKSGVTPLFLWQHGEEIEQLLIEYGAEWWIPSNE